MKTFKPLTITVRSVLCAAFAAGLALVQSAPGQSIVYDDAFHYTKTNWGFTNLVNLGTGFTPWLLATNGAGFHGFFTAHNVGTPPAPTISSPTNTSSPPGNDGSAHVWGLFANGNKSDWTVAYRGFSNSLTTNVVFKLDWQNDGIGSHNTNLAGFCLRTGNTYSGVSDVADYNANQVFSFYYIGGGQNDYVIWDGNGPNYVPIPYTSAGLACEFTLEANATYRFVVKNATNGNIVLLEDGQPLITSGTIDSLSLFCEETSGNQEFNFMQVVSASLIPPTIINVLPTNNSIYVGTAANNLSFEVTSLASTVSSNGIQLFLNGALQNNLVFNTTSATSDLLVTNNAALALNTFYNATIIATDANGNRATNNFSFNTFSPVNTCIEAEDYNYGAGQYFGSPTPDEYAGLLGTNGIDYLDLTTLTNLNDYRPDYTTGDPPLPQLLPVTMAEDPYDHDMYFENSTQDWQLAYTDLGEWENYTRSFPGTPITIYARAAAAGTGVFEIDQLVSSPASTTYQPRAALGTCTVALTGGSTIYGGPMVPLVDAFGNTVVLNLSGVNTLRQTALTSRGYNLNYLMLVPSTNTSLLKPYLSLASPAPGATGVQLDSAITFSIANRQTSVNPSTIKVLLNSTNITSSVVFSNNAAGTAATYTPTMFLTPGASNLVTVSFTDNTGTNNVTNSWSFIAASQTVVTMSNVLASNPSSTSGFGLSIYKIDNSGPQPGNVTLAAEQLNGQITNQATGFPWTNEINNTFFPALDIETNTLNYDVTGAPTGSYTFATKSPFPDISTSGAQYNFVVQALFYLHLNAGSYHLVVRSDDGFGLNNGPTPANATQVLGQFNSGRANTTPSDIFVNAPSNGYYPMNLLYFQEGSGASLEFYSITGGVPILINDPANPNSLKAFAALSVPYAVTILNPAHSGNSTTFTFATQPGFTYYVEYKNSLADPAWTLLTTIAGDGTSPVVTDTTANGATRFYRVRIPAQ